MPHPSFPSRRVLCGLFPVAGTPLLWLAMALALPTPAATRVSLPVPPSAASSERPQTHGKRKPPAAPPPARPVQEIPVPFRAGERLTYRVLWSKYSVNAATIEFQALEHGNFFGYTAWHFRALAHTVETMRFVYPLDDQFDSYTETSHLSSVEYEMYVREQGKQQNSSWRITPDGRAVPAAPMNRIRTVRRWPSCPARVIRLGSYTPYAPPIGKKIPNFVRRYLKDATFTM